ncbi:MAG: hypothetical protein QM767_08765 [Anaeromyxobacter sp.]
MNREDRATETVERQTSRIPSLAFMGFAVAAMAASAALVLTGRKQLGNFVGQWAPSILIMGLYNKVAKEIAVPRREGLGYTPGMGASGGYAAGAGASAGV